MNTANDIRASTDEELVSRFCTSHDEAAFTLLVQRYGALVRATARQVVVDEHRAEDVHQAVFMVLCKDAHRIRNTANLAGWLYGVTYRIATRVLNKQQKQRVMAHTEPASESDALTDLIARIERDKVLKELHQLPEKYRTILILKYYRQMTVGQVANALRISVDTVAGRLKRGRNEMRLRLARQGIRFLAFAAVIDSMTSKAVAAESVKQTVTLCLTIKPQTATEINHLAQEEASSMFSRYLLKNVTITTVTVCAITFGMASWPTVRGTTWGQEGESTPAGLTVTATAESSQDRARPEKLQIAATSQSSEERTTGLGGASDRDNGQHITATLSRKTDIQFANAPLAEVINTISQSHAIPIVIDAEGLAAEGVTQDMPVSLEVNGIKLENALKLVLRPHRLTAVVLEDVLLVTGQQSADEYTTSTKAYPFDSTKIEADKLTKLIKTKTAPNSWEEVGGTGSVDVVGGALVVRNAERVHKEIADLFGILELLSK